MARWAAARGHAREDCTLEPRHFTGKPVAKAPFSQFRAGSIEGGPAGLSFVESVTERCYPSITAVFSLYSAATL